MYLSNAPLYEAEERLRIFNRQTDRVKRDMEEDRIFSIIERFVQIINLCRRYPDPLIVEENNGTVEAIIDTSALRKLR